MKDSVLYISLRAVIFTMRFLPIGAWLFLARCSGRIYYYFAGRKNKTAYINLKQAFAGKPPRELKNIIVSMYQKFAQNLIEAFYLPYMDEAYIRGHVHISGLSAITEALKDERSIIFLGSHAGSWELSNIACAAFFKERRYAMLAAPQSKHKKLDAFLNSVRERKGCGVIPVVDLKRLIAHLSENNVLGAVADHGGKDGIPVEFFGKTAMTPTGSIKLAKKMGSRIILAFMRRVRGPYHELYLHAYELVPGSDAADELELNLSRINKVFQNRITQYPSEYLWFYKRWKYSPQRNILVLSDGKLGHLKQSLSLVEIISGLGFEVKTRVVDVFYKGRGSRNLFSLAALFCGPKLALIFLPLCLKKESFTKIMRGSYDIVVSAGSSLAAVNMAATYENNAKSIVIMKPGILPKSNFDCVLMPEHDEPALRKNILLTAGALNAVDKESIKKDFQKLLSRLPHLSGFDSLDKPKIGLLIGGNSKNYLLTTEQISFLCGQLKRLISELDGYLFLTTSRRTPDEIVSVLKANFKDDERCKFLCIASQDNPPGTVGGIFYLSDVVIVSGESISMVSEAASSGKYTVVFEPRCTVRENKVRRFLGALADGGYIYLTKVNDIYDRLSWLIRSRPAHSSLETRSEVSQALKKLLEL